MKLVDPSATLLFPHLLNDAVERIEFCGRLAYKSQEKIAPGTAAPFVRTLRDQEHGTVIEHAHATIHFVTNRGVSHELCRHRTGITITQESTRYCNYSRDQFGNGVTFLQPHWRKSEDTDWIDWHLALAESERVYLEMLAKGKRLTLWIVGGTVLVKVGARLFMALA